MKSASECLRVFKEIRDEAGLSFCVKSTGGEICDLTEALTLDALKALEVLLAKLNPPKKKPTKKVSQEASPFDFESLRSIYPKRHGFSLGLTVAKAEIKTQEDFDLLKVAIRNYAESVNGSDPKFTKQFKNFLLCWRDYVDTQTLSLIDPALEGT